MKCSPKEASLHFFNAANECPSRNFDASIQSGSQEASKSASHSRSINFLPLRHHTVMAARLLPLQSILHLFQPAQAARQPLFSSPTVQRIFRPSLPLSIPLAAFAGAADILREIWDGLLRAVPKKKTSHMYGMRFGNLGRRTDSEQEKATPADGR